MRTLIFPLPFSLLLLFQTGFGQTNEEIFHIELKGKVVIPKNDPGRTFRMLLLCDHKVIDSADVTDDEEFLMRVKKNTMYSVRILKPGYLPMVISLNTYSPEVLMQQQFDFSNSLFVDLYGFNLSLSILDKTLIAKSPDEEVVRSN